MRLKWIVAAAAVVACAFAGSAFALIGGAPDGNRHPYVGAAVYFPTGNPADGAALCSGSLVSPTVFVTAAHCFPDGATVLVDTNEAALADLHQPGFGSGVPGVVHNHPRYHVEGAPPNDVQVDDVAVVTLAGPIASPRYGKLLLRDGTRVDDVAYGVPTAGVRQVAQQTVIRGRDVPQNDLELSAGVTCLGDSGGPDLLAGTDIMLAVNSFGPSADCGGVTYSQRLDTLDVWLFLLKYVR